MVSRRVGIRQAKVFVVDSSVDYFLDHQIVYPIQLNIQLIVIKSQDNNQDKSFNASIK